MTLRRVILLGPPGSGKSWLARALTDALQARGFCVVPAQHTAEPDQTRPGSAQAQWCISEALQAPGQQDPDAHTLLMGLDLPGHDPDRQRQDSQLRQALDRAHIPYRVVYGTGLVRLNNALLALDLTAPEHPDGLDRESQQFRINRGRDAWVCNDCSDPGCEHQLFTRLLDKRSG